MSVAEAVILARKLPNVPDLLEGIASGKYKIWGGVVRLNKGQEGAGQIVGHLLIPNNAAELADQLQGQLGTLQSLHTANLVMSGLNLAVSAAGFAIVCQKLNKISGVLSEQTQKLDTLVRLAQKQDLRNMFADLAEFTGLLKTVKQFSDMEELEQLKSLIGQINKQYDFTKYLLLDVTKSAANDSFISSIDEVECLSDRLVHLALVKAYINQKVGHTMFAIESLEELQNDWLAVNKNIVNAMTQNKAFVSSLSIDSAQKVKSLLEFRQQRLPAIEYQTNVLKLIKDKPEAARLFNSFNEEILFIAA
ncbi:hypothetical protein [Photobacterium phosphoreum]|jgi:hypothetical protein|uniref:hypothetical protein n=1 Tax=Photobacterium phosphoreum TaxID=659 RepID=UPI0007F8C8D6|nr:hypothetical protein [Photobacterium phosphoreum]OBU36616.1 hypothetical protein AYY24_14100 [Photobacterium phosphoreum]PSW38722.1 hypothetical protein CTM87_00025 [Photobacterium phosphoreum]